MSKEKVSPAIRRTLLRRRDSIDKEIKALQEERDEINSHVGYCSKSQYCMQEDGHSGGCSDYTIS